MFRQAVGIALGLALLLSVAADGDELRGKSPAMAAFVSRLQQAVDQHDSRAVAALFQFPATVLIGGWRLPVDTARTLLAVYDQLFTPHLRCLIDQSPVQVAGDGLALADGAIWAQLHQGQFKIQRLIVPSSSVPRRARQPSRTVTFADPRYPARYAGTLVQDDAIPMSSPPGRARCCERASTAFAVARRCCAAGT